MSASLLHDSAVDVMVAVVQNMVLTKMREGEGANYAPSTGLHWRKVPECGDTWSVGANERQREVVVVVVVVVVVAAAAAVVVVVTLVTVMDAISAVGDGGVTETSSNDLTYNIMMTRVDYRHKTIHSTGTPEQTQETENR